MAYTLTIGVGVVVKVNGASVTSGYTLKDKDVIDVSVTVRPGFGAQITVNYKGGYLSYKGTGNQVDLADTDIRLTQLGVSSAFPSTAKLIINYSESVGGSILDVTYNTQKIIDSAEVTPPVAVTYNGSTIATLNGGDTKTLDILGSDNKPKILATPIVIGGKTIPDVDALGRKWVLEHNLVVEVKQ